MSDLRALAPHYQEPTDRPAPDVPYARIIADSINASGDRLTTAELRIHRWVLAELNTHRALSRNSESSRAVPIAKRVEIVEEWPAHPIAWTSEQPGMSGGPELEDADLDEAEDLWYGVAHESMKWVRRYLQEHPDSATRLHKSRLNRLLEPFLMHTVVITATDLSGLFAQRDHPAAEPEIAVPMAMLRKAYEASTPQLLEPGDWHLPYITREDWDEADARWPGQPTLPFLIRASASRCAGTSYGTQGIRDLDKDLARYAKLVNARPGHWSPLEHPATVALDNALVVHETVPLIDGGTREVRKVLPRYGNFLGWQQLRFQVEQ